MTKMFDSYDNPGCECIEHCGCSSHKNPDIIQSYSGAEVIMNALGKEIGLAFDHNSEVTFMFHVTGTVQNDEGKYISVEDFINSNNIRFELFDFNSRAVVSTELNGHMFEDMIYIKLSSKICQELDPGIYRLRLQVITEDSMYTLFSPGDAIVNIY